ncbi:uncharacterized protein [Zea mays]|uniref:Uncharacterized protein n=1 Tax=Zea mays TaxID=4577 RepID=A0A804R7F7_MAIZE|nr:uncharacterized protein LOC100382867 isoform X2 [Zea mays]
MFVAARATLPRLPHHPSLLVLPAVAGDRDHGTHVVVLALLAMLLLQGVILMSTVEGLVWIMQEAPQVPHQEDQANWLEGSYQKCSGGLLISLESGNSLTFQLDKEKNMWFKRSHTSRSSIRSRWRLPVDFMATRMILSSFYIYLLFL